MWFIANMYFRKVGFFYELKLEVHDRKRGCCELV